MISTVLKAETAYLATFENQQISIMKKKEGLLRKIYWKFSITISENSQIKNFRKFSRPEFPNRVKKAPYHAKEYVSDFVTFEN